MKDKNKDYLFGNVKYFSIAPVEMINKKRKLEIEVDNINEEVIKYFKQHEITYNNLFYRPQPFIDESCEETVNLEIENFDKNLIRLNNLQENEFIEINPVEINNIALEFAMLENNEIETHTKTYKIATKKKSVKIDTKCKNTSSDIFSDEKSTIRSSLISEEQSTTRLSDISSDKRLLFFLKKTNPNFYKTCESVKDYVEKTEAIILEKGKMNLATQKLLKEEKKNIYTKKHKPHICKLELLKETFWTETEKNKFKHSVLKYKNNFNLIHKEFSERTRKEIIYRYYNNKDKTYNYIKKKGGRISDKECDAYILGTWTDLEKKIFDENYVKFGKILIKYQTILPKSIKDLKLYLRWYLKNKTIKTKRISSSILDDWSIDERQIFAIYYPFFNKNWITMSVHFTSKNSKDLKMYYSKYFKHLSYAEQKFETCLKEHKLKNHTDPVLHVGDKTSDWCESVGWIFKTDDSLK